MSPGPPRLVGDTAAALDRLVALARASVDVGGALTMGEGMDLKTYSLRLDPEWFDLADKLVNDLSDTDAARAAGGQWGRAAVLRIACRRGLQELEAEAVALRKARRVPRRAKPSEDAP